LESPRTVAAAMPHRRGLGDHAVDSHAETELGRMLLRGELGDDGRVLELAGSTYARLQRGYVATLAGPQAIINGGLGLTCAGCMTAEERKHCRCSMRKAIFLEAQRMLFSIGPRVGTVVEIVAVLDRQCPFEGLAILHLGLRKLAQHFGFSLTKRHNSFSQNALSEL